MLDSRIYLQLMCALLKPIIQDQFKTEKARLMQSMFELRTEKMRLEDEVDILKVFADLFWCKTEIQCFVLKASPLSLSLCLYIYIYIYICLSVCLSL